MSRRPPRSRLPQINLLRPPSRGFRPPVPGRFAELGLIVVALLAWGTAAVGVALLLGLRPHLGGGP